MSAILNLGSLVLGVISWLIPIVVLWQGKKRDIGVGVLVSSSTSCAAALILQILEIRNRVHLEDWTAIMDTIDILPWVATILVIITAILNLFALKKLNNK